ETIKCYLAFMNLLSEKIIAFNQNLKLTAALPENIRFMNPFVENDIALATSSQFYRKYYADQRPRQMILGINPGRHGAGVTGVPFTDTKRLEAICKIPFAGKSTHEPSSVFVYEVIKAYGGPEAFYQEVYINSVCPLGFVIQDEKGREKNYNYYDSKGLTQAVEPFIIKSIQAQIDFGLKREVCLCLGSNKNFKYLQALNKKHHFFEQIIPLEHPRYVIQYKSKHLTTYVEKYLDALQTNRPTL
ncbi:MAG: uracil-DNA glycosylase family protein, partial [Bacteroidota bacterium]